MLQELTDLAGSVKGRWRRRRRCQGLSMCRQLTARICKSLLHHANSKLIKSLEGSFTRFFKWVQVMLRCLAATSSAASRVASSGFQHTSPPADLIPPQRLVLAMLRGLQGALLVTLTDCLLSLQARHLTICLTCACVCKDVLRVCIDMQEIVEFASSVFDRRNFRCSIFTNLFREQGIFFLVLWFN